MISSKTAIDVSVAKIIVPDNTDLPAGSPAVFLCNKIETYFLSTRTTDDTSYPVGRYYDFVRYIEHFCRAVVHVLLRIVGHKKITRRDFMYPSSR